MKRSSHTVLMAGMFKSAIYTYQCYGRSFPEFLTNKYWQADHWARFLKVAPFVFKDILPAEHMCCMLLHVKYLGLLMRESLSLRAIDEAERLFLECVCQHHVSVY